MPDQVIVCTDCKSEFIFNEGEQKFYAARDFEQPKRCKECREKRKQRIENLKSKGKSR